MCVSSETICFSRSDLSNARLVPMYPRKINDNKIRYLLLKKAKIKAMFVEFIYESPVKVSFTYTNKLVLP